MLLSDHKNVNNHNNNDNRNKEIKMKQQTKKIKMSLMSKTVPNGLIIKGSLMSKVFSNLTAVSSFTDSLQQRVVFFTCNENCLSMLSQHSGQVVERLGLYE